MNLRSYFAMLPVCAVLLTATAPHLRAQPAPLIVVEDRGGASALPYYQALDLQPRAGEAPAPRIDPPRTPERRFGEADMLPVRSTKLSVGEEPRRTIQAPGLTPIFLVGGDDRSRAWLRQRAAALRGLGAVGLVVQVDTEPALAALRALAPGVTLVPASGDDLAHRLDLRHYPVLITATGIEP